ncbi:hypothetical protein [Lederbergia citrea]|uniref:hypothetical protein n=1 Tax=Lederbergia citrea TaxID=2833581 RepID=UPI0020163064|nr:hypothetical protein [Lederbergia citrea]
MSRPVTVICILRSIRKGLWEEARIYADFRHKENIQSADQAQFPFIHSLKEEMFAGDTVSMERFRWGLEVILHGIQQSIN